MLRQEGLTVVQGARPGFRPGRFGWDTRVPIAEGWIHRQAHSLPHGNGDPTRGPDFADVTENDLGRYGNPLAGALQATPVEAARPKCISSSMLTISSSQGCTRTYFEKEIKPLVATFLQRRGCLNLHQRKPG